MSESQANPQNIREIPPIGNRNGGRGMKRIYGRQAGNSKASPKSIIAEDPRGTVNQSLIPKG